MVVKRFIRPQVNNKVWKISKKRLDQSLLNFLICQTILSYIGASLRSFSPLAKLAMSSTAKSVKWCWHCRSSIKTLFLRRHPIDTGPRVKSASAGAKYHEDCSTVLRNRLCFRMQNTIDTVLEWYTHYSTVQNTIDTVTGKLSNVAIYHGHCHMVYNTIDTVIGF